MRTILTNRPGEIQPGFEITVKSYVHHAPTVGEDVTICSAADQSVVGRGTVLSVGANNGGCWTYMISVTEGIR
jgi:hypothetical protein